jgi:hypothetical protein
MKPGIGALLAAPVPETAAAEGFYVLSASAADAVANGRPSPANPAVTPSSALLAMNSRRFPSTERSEASSLS